MRFPPALRFFRRDVESSREQDPADLGTAFGMEASLAGEDSFYRTTTEYALESESALAALESPLAWMSRRPT